MTIIVENVTVRQGLPGATLIKQNHTLPVQVKPVQHGELAAAAGAAMQHHGCRPVGAAVLRYMQRMAIAGGDLLLVERRRGHEIFKEIITLK